MAIQSFEDIAITDLCTESETLRPSSAAGTTQLYHEDVAPSTPLKDPQYRKLSRQRSLADTLRIFSSNNMYQSAIGSQRVDHFDSYSQDSVFDPPFACYFDSKLGGSLTGFEFAGEDPSESPRDTSSSGSSSGSPASPRQSLLPPLPPSLRSRSQELLTSSSPYPPPRRPLPATPLAERPVRRTALDSPSKRSITPLQLEQLSQSPLPAIIHRRRTPSPSSALGWNCARPAATSFSSVSTAVTLNTLDSTMSSLSNADTISHRPAAGSTARVPSTDSSTTFMRSKGRKPIQILQCDNLDSTAHDRLISLPLEAKSSSLIGADFDFGLPSHDFQPRRASPVPGFSEISLSSPLLSSSYSPSELTPTTPSSIQPFLPPCPEEKAEVSAFDFDSDDDRPSAPGTTLRKMVSRSVLRSRNRAETVPAANPRIASKGASLPRRVSKQDIKTPGIRISNGPDSAIECGITVPHSPEPLRVSHGGARPHGANSAASILRKKSSNRESPPPKIRRTSGASKASKRSDVSCKNSMKGVLRSSSPTGGNQKGSSGHRFRNWFAKVFQRRNTG